MLSAVIAMFAGVAFSSVAEDYRREGEAFARKLLKEKAESNFEFSEPQNPNLEKAFAEAKKLVADLRDIPAGKGCRECGGGIQNAAAGEMNKETDSENGILVVVSFSMPKPALKILSEQAEKHGAQLILRGIVDGSFRKTGEVARSIPTNCDLFVHPELFEKYAVRRVPTFVKVKDGKEVGRLCGNVDLEFACLKLGGKKP
jgi:conjugal transfer pilus assembly protein TrbC